MYYGRKERDDLESLADLSAGAAQTIPAGFTASGSGFGTSGATGGGVPAGATAEGGTAVPFRGGIGPGSRFHRFYSPSAGRIIGRFQGTGVQTRAAAFGEPVVPGAPITFPTGGLFNPGLSGIDGLSIRLPDITRPFRRAAQWTAKRVLPRAIRAPIKKAIRIGGSVPIQMTTFGFLPAGTSRQVFGYGPKESKYAEIGQKVYRGAAIATGAAVTGAWVAGGEAAAPAAAGAGAGAGAKAAPVAAGKGGIGGWLANLGTGTAKGVAQTTAAVYAARLAAGAQPFLPAPTPPANGNLPFTYVDPGAGDEYFPIGQPGGAPPPVVRAGGFTPQNVVVAGLGAGLLYLLWANR